MIVKVDSNDFVISVEPEAGISAFREIRRSDFMPEATRICKGPWHYKNGKGTVLPLAMFPENRYRKGTLTKTCGECLEKSGKRSAIPLGVKAMPEATTPVPLVKNLEGNGFLPANGGLQHKWKVTVEVLVIQRKEVEVYAKDYLDAGVQAGEGDVVNVERLD